MPLRVVGHWLPAVPAHPQKSTHARLAQRRITQRIQDTSAGARTSMDTRNACNHEITQARKRDGGISVIRCTAAVKCTVQLCAWE